MEEIRQQEYVSNIPPSKPQQTHQKNEDVEEGGVTPLPFRIYLESFKETKTQIFAHQDRSKWLEFILKKLAESNLQNKELIERSTCAICTGRCTRAEPWIAHMQSSTIF